MSSAKEGDGQGEGLEEGLRDWLSDSEGEGVAETALGPDRVALIGDRGDENAGPSRCVAGKVGESASSSSGTPSRFEAGWRLGVSSRSSGLSWVAI